MKPGVSLFKGTVSWWDEPSPSAAISHFSSQRKGFLHRYRRSFCVLPALGHSESTTLQTSETSVLDLALSSGIPGGSGLILLACQACRYAGQCVPPPSCEVVAAELMKTLLADCLPQIEFLARRASRQLQYCLAASQMGGCAGSGGLRPVNLHENNTRTSQREVFRRSCEGQRPLSRTPHHNARCNKQNEGYNSPFRSSEGSIGRWLIAPSRSRSLRLPSPAIPSLPGSCKDRRFL